MLDISFNDSGKWDNIKDQNTDVNILIADGWKRCNSMREKNYDKVLKKKNVKLHGLDSTCEVRLYYNTKTSGNYGLRWERKIID